MFDIKDFPLPFEYDALAPHMSAQTLTFHHDKHLGAYINNLNALLPGSKYEKMSLEEIIAASAKDSAAPKVFNNAAQIFNHDFFFKCLKKDSAAPVPEAVKPLLAEFKAAATAVFGSGWTWLALDGKELKVVATPNADTPLAHGLRPVLTIDVWEHAYYLDYQNRRPDFIDAFLNHLVNWEFVAGNL
ncbi:MAG: superoxide dismutase [Rickettsiales bacterium]|jgi:Fe-Mn family superoxide dismutase|nr:superoxide dismutase [Rickettsiales bacterium]